MGSAWLTAPHEARQAKPGRIKTAARTGAQPGTAPELRRPGAYARYGMIQGSKHEGETYGKPCLASVMVLASKSPGYSGCVLVTVCVTFGGGSYAYARLYYMCGAGFVQVAYGRAVLHPVSCIRFPG